MTTLDEILQQHFLRPGQLSLVTSVLGACASWYEHALISKILSTGDVVIHISFMHQATFHNDCMRKLGIDLAQYSQKEKYFFVDGFTGLFFQPTGQRCSRGCPVVRPSLQGLSDDVNALIEEVLSALEEGSKAYLVIESPDLLLAAGGYSSLVLLNELLDWHDRVYSTTVMIHADSALVSQTRSRFETESASFATSLAHEASILTSLRMLDTGLARDISGVLRITKRPEISAVVSEHGWNDKEVLYFVNDGSVDVFSRGEMRA
ncbi:hypothetical protein FN846DRAFT_911140 [Sphaerosporella brunnea]|uniref:Elongator complex protein 6 n=1 Tax=Sphaerosporella brunnea TaxID=1250544 RepID=A0A5J5ELR6_9PEZI|nr:hypothetical protein FN846DRAFT_911140 [Sphaerosporella brunnea]